MIEHNSEVYNHPYISFFIVHVYSYMEEDFCRGTYLFSLYMCIAIWKKISVGGVNCILHCFDHPSCFLTFGRSGIPTPCYVFYTLYHLRVVCLHSRMQDNYSL